MAIANLIHGLGKEEVDNDCRNSHLKSKYLSTYWTANSSQLGQVGKRRQWPGWWLWKIQFVVPNCIATRKAEFGQSHSLLAFRALGAKIWEKVFLTKFSRLLMDSLKFLVSTEPVVDTEWSIPDSARQKSMTEKSCDWHALKIFDQNYLFDTMSLWRWPLTKSSIGFYLLIRALTELISLIHWTNARYVEWMNDAHFVCEGCFSFHQSRERSWRLAF